MTSKPPPQRRIIALFKATVSEGGGLHKKTTLFLIYHVSLRGVHMASYEKDVYSVSDTGDLATNPSTPNRSRIFLPSKV